jgi:hypothetical protein
MIAVEIHTTDGTPLTQYRQNVLRGSACRPADAHAPILFDDADDGDVGGRSPSTHPASQFGVRSVAVRDARDASCDLHVKRTHCANQSIKTLATANACALVLALLVDGHTLHEGLDQAALDLL